MPPRTMPGTVGAGTGTEAGAGDGTTCGRPFIVMLSPALTVCPLTVY